MNGEKSILSFSRSLRAGANCPQRDPRTVISSITIGAKFSSLPDATVLFNTKTPLGLVNDIEVSNPEAVPVASTTTSYIFCGVNSLSNWVLTPWAFAISNLFWCFPTSKTSRFRAFSVSAVVSPSLPSPSTRTFAVGIMNYSGKLENSFWYAYL